MTNKLSKLSYQTCGHNKISKPNQSNQQQNKLSHPGIWASVAVTSLWLSWGVAEKLWNPAESMNSTGEVKRASFLPTMCCRTSSPICLTVWLRSKCNDLSWSHYCCSCSQRCPPVHRLPSIQLCKEPRRSLTLKPASQTFTFFSYVDRSGLSIIIWVILTRKSGQRTGPSRMPFTRDICLDIWGL